MSFVSFITQASGSFEEPSLQITYTVYSLRSTDTECSPVQSSTVQSNAVCLVGLTVKYLATKPFKRFP